MSALHCKTLHTFQRRTVQISLAWAANLNSVQSRQNPPTIKNKLQHCKVIKLFKKKTPEGYFTQKTSYVV